MLPSLSIPQTVREDATAVTTIAVVLDAALDAYRAGTTEAFLLSRPGGARWITRRFLQPILGTAGDTLPLERRQSVALEWLLAWAITQLRPDHSLTFEIADRQCWLERTSWRPAIAIMCHYGFAPVPEFRDRYYRRQGESPADNLCGLWNIGQSTFYRYLDKGKRLMAKLLHEQRLDQRHMASLREYVRRAAERAQGTGLDLRAWHLAQSTSAHNAGDYLSALWHARTAGNFRQMHFIVSRNVAAIASQPELDQLLAATPQDALDIQDHVHLLFSWAAVWRARADAKREREAYEQALRLAVEADDPVSIGIVYGNLGKYFENRDSERAFAYYQDSATFLSRAVELNKTTPRADVREEYVSTLIKLAWLYVLRNDPRAHPVLDKAQLLHDTSPVPPQTQAMLEQAWGEYYRRAGQLDRALEHRHKALNIYERLNDQEGIIKAHLNLGLVYLDQKRLERADAAYRHVLKLTETGQVNPELLASAHLNLGACLYWQKRLDEALTEYQAVLRVSDRGDMTLWAARAYYGLAETHYTRFLILHNEQDEQCGDEYLAAAIEAYEGTGNLSYAEQSRNLKSDILSQAPKEMTDDRLLSGEQAAHVSEMSDVEQHRATLAAPGKPEEHIRAYLAIANAYLAISAKEREQALALIDKHGLRDQFAAEFAQLRATYERELTREQKLAAQWQAQAGDLISDDKRTAMLKHLVEHGSVNKSGYAELCSVGLATASKHLGQLSEMGLLTQVGKGPSTRYVLS